MLEFSLPAEEAKNDDKIYDVNLGIWGSMSYVGNVFEVSVIIDSRIGLAPKFLEPMLILYREESKEQS